MKKKFITRKQQRKIPFKFFFFFFFLCFGLYLSFLFLDKSTIKITDVEVANFLVAVSLKEKVFSVEAIIEKIKPTSFLQNNYGYSKESKKEIPVIKEENPLIYIYNSHQTEEYHPSNFLEFSVTPTVMVADYILEDLFEQNGFSVIVEERSIKNVLKENNWKYAYSYKASRIFMEDVEKNNPSLRYFIDVHRDSLSKDKTTVTIGEKEYAKTIFLIGMENSNYEENLEFTEKINNKINEKYPGLSKGIYKKGGIGVNGVYNQDFSNRVILIEIGGYENSLTEVLNSTLAFAECFMEVINEEI
ncbi:MAG: stage II sporulation protein P [bacterium]|nr:stage II sporulation protein P [bacterium]